MAAAEEGFTGGRVGYRWVIVLAGMIGLFAGLGLGRFSLGMMLPAMGEALGLSYSRMGVISTINFCGYLGAVLLCGPLTRLLGPRLLISCGLVLVGSSMILVGLTAAYPLILLLYCCTGVGSALANVPIMALISTWFEPQSRGRAAGFCVMGNGLGILFSGKMVPALGHFDNWQLNWLVLGGLVLASALICFMLVRNSPERKGVQPPIAGGGRESIGIGRIMKQRGVTYCAVLYFLFGFTYVIFITFMVTSLVQERQFTEQAAGDVWAIVGVLSLVSGPLFGYYSDRRGRKAALILVFLIQAAAYLLIALKLPVLSVYVSAIAFAMVAFSIPTIIAALVGDYSGAQNAATAFGCVTFVFGTGQIVGPAVAGVLAGWTGTFSWGFLLAAVLAASGAALSCLLPQPPGSYAVEQEEP